MMANLLFMLSIRFFLFDFILFVRVRKYLRRYYVFRKLFSCTFCQGFWIGLLIAIYENHQITISSLLYWLYFAFISAIASFTWSVAFYPLIKKFEADNDLPMTEHVEKHT